MRAATASEGLKLFERSPPHLVLLDVGLPDLSGFEVCKEIRRTSAVPILFLTARSSEVDRVVGLEIGADDYVTKPFSPREVVARVKAILRRASAPSTPKTEGAFAVDESKRSIRFRGIALELSRYEYGILAFLLKHPGRVYSRTQLMEAVWEEPEMSLERTIDAHVKAIRGKLRAIAPDEEIIETHRGFGYSISERIL
jgi:two-component system catabolic regulation response regulator CreB